MGNRWLAVAALALATACGGSSSKSNTGGGTALQCSYPAQSMCFTVRAPAYTAAQTTALQGECTADGGTYGTGACATTNAVAGACTVTNPANLPTTQVTGMTVVGTFYSPTFTPAIAAATCATMGTWSGSGGGGGGGGAATVSCTWAGDGCQTVSGTITAAELTALQGACTGSGGTYAASACSTAGAVAGSCYYANGAVVLPVAVAGATTVRAYYYTASWNLTTAQADCAAPPAGVWQ